MGFRKYGNKATGGFDSKLEAAVGGFLELREKNGEIRDLRRQQTVVLQDGPPNMRITWRVDFSYQENEQLTYAEAKGFPDEIYKLKLKLWRGQRKWPLEIYEGRHDNFHLSERIEKL